MKESITPDKIESLFVTTALLQRAYSKVFKTDRQAWIYDYERTIWTKKKADYMAIELMETKNFN